MTADLSKETLDALAAKATASSKEMAGELWGRIGVKKLIEIWHRHQEDVRAWSNAVNTMHAASIEALTARATTAEAALAAKKERKSFPILNGGGARFDYQLVADHGGQAKANHYQTVDRLAERGGLSWQELHAVLHDRKFQKVDQNTAIAECRAIEARYLSALEPAAQDREALVAATLERARKAIASRRALLNSQFEALDIAREDAVFAICEEIIADLAKPMRGQIKAVSEEASGNVDGTE